MLVLLCLAQMLEDAGKTSLLSGLAQKMKRWTVSVDGGLVTFLAQEGKESTANLQLLSLAALWLDQRGHAGNVASGALGGTDRSSAPTCELWICLPRVMQGRADVDTTAIGASWNFLMSFVHYQLSLPFLFHGE